MKSQSLGVPKIGLAQDVTTTHFQYPGAHYDDWQVPQDIDVGGLNLKT
jgi:hypothetical protein